MDARMTRVIHTGDTHIGYRQYHSSERRGDFLRAFEQVVEDAVDENVDAVVHAGDLFHDRRPDLQDLLGVLSALRRLQDADVPFLAIVGNHEATRGGQWLDLFENLDLATRLGQEPYVVNSTAFYGLDHVPKSRRSDLEYRFEPHDVDHAALVGHGLFTPFPHGNWETETVLSEANVEFDAMLLGDNHIHDTAEVADAWVTYCGSTERASADERSARGYNLVTFDGDVAISHRSLETRPFAFVGVDLAEGEGTDRVRERLREHDLEDAVVVVEVTGEGDPVTPASVEEFALERGALIARVTDRREFDSEAELSVNFADPDDAVRERIREMGLSRAALDVDETVRASKTADANVREEVRGRVTDLLDEGLGAFERDEASDDESSIDSTDDASTDSVDESPTGSTDDSLTESVDDSPTDSAAAEPSRSADSPETAAVDEPAAEPDADEQVSMEDYQ